MKKKIIITLILLVVPTLIILNNENKEEQNKLAKIENMISYTIDGKSTSEKINKTSGYIVKSITCDNNTNLVWDNTNWEVELIKLESSDNCIIDFTKEESTGNTIKINTTIEEGIDSISKTTIENGKIIFYPKENYTITGVSGCSGKIENGNLIITNITAPETCDITMKKENQTLYEQILADKTTRPGKRTDFSNVLTTENTKTLYTEDGNYTEGGKTVYYFAGNATDNWVKFGKDQDNADLYWRIVRINEDNSVRLLYIGPDPATTTAFIKLDGTYMSGGSNTTGMYNNIFNDTMYVGYMYGSTGSLSNNRQNTTNAPIKTVTDNWYSKTINVKTDASGNTYDKYVSQTAIYCNDRSGDGYVASGAMNYAAYKRLVISSVSSRRSSYKCGNNPSGTLYSDNNQADKFTKSTTTGNGKLTYPIAQITADEIAFAGGVYGAESRAWYYYNSAGGSAVGSDSWWTMSPSRADDGRVARMFFVYGSSYPGYLATWHVYNTTPGVRPVLSLKSCVLASGGNGSSSNPYTVTLDNACSLAEN